ncbi:MAG: efflux RND transporter periplasmic adaptor subunit [Bacteroidia bacterium]|jgi:cobalt-zinc-cadmium efflux system membrane fusion protein|nr:efflux RND transporter periplasmic adaptor subunit [Bacteroidota bacterium]MBP6511921.1 efflux RND transporter periplasmic adaptor subunit [Bacteroidia bacterium]MBP7244878.1 efflux RND transporter periplasmic adaptor subunit [Bacteroidia bacterium]
MNKFILITTIAVLILNSCSSITEEHQHDHDKVPEVEPIAFTMYSEKSEIFVEFKPLVVGNTSKFAAHFTVLGEKFLPLTDGSVTVSLIVNGNVIKQSAAKPSVPGIYSLELTPKTAGTGKLVFDIVTKSFTDQIVIEDVKVYADEKAMLTERTQENANSDISYLKEQAWKVEFANAPVSKQSFSNIIKTNGQILSAPGDEMMVIAKASGTVLFSGRKTIIGSEVTAGTNLFTVTGADIAEGNIDAKYKDAKANYEKAKLDYERASELLKDQIVSQRDFQQTKLVFDNAQTAFNAIAKNHSAKGQAVLANISGYVKNIFITEGQFVEAGTPLATISKNKKLILQANVSQKYFNNLSTITSANFKTTESETVYSTAQLNGKIISYGRSATAHSPFIPVTFEIDNTRNLIPGSVAEVYLKSIPIPSALVLPVTSLLEEQGNFFVYVQTGGESFQKREVEIGASDGILVQLLSGVVEGERVVTKGAYQIKLATATGTLPAHGHEH